MGTRETLRHVQRPFEMVVLARERSLIAALALPHVQADLDRLLEHLESLGKRWEGKAQTARFLFIPTSADAQHRPAAGEHVERGNHLGEKGRMPEVHPGYQWHEPAPSRMGGDDAERGEALQLRLLRTAHVGTLPEMVGHADHVESGVVSSASDPGQRLRHAGRSAFPGIIRNLYAKFHAAYSIQSVGLKTIAQITDASTSRLSQLRSEIRCRKAATRESLGPAVRANAPSSAPVRPRATTPRRMKTTKPTKPQTIQSEVNGIPNWPAIHKPAIKTIPIAGPITVRPKASLCCPSAATATGSPVRARRALSTVSAKTPPTQTATAATWMNL